MPGPERPARTPRRLAPGRLPALLLAAGLLAGCGTIRVKPGAERIPIHFEVEPVRGCTYLGEIVGSEGHWYTYLFLANESMTRAALNDLRNKAHARGADTLYVPSYPLLFRTSVTILGQAFGCGSRGRPRDGRAPRRCGALGPGDRPRRRAPSARR